MNRRLVVFGGNGFLGKRLCQFALESNKFSSIIALSRSGCPPTLHEPWFSSIQWSTCDIFEPQTYKHYLSDATDVVHTIGILLEDPNYKKSINAGQSSRIYSQTLKLLLPKFGSNPLKQKNERFTYDYINRLSAELLVKAFVEEVKGRPHPRCTFTYVSADKSFPMIPSGYINSKRQAEATIMKYEDIVRPILLRPGFMHDESSKANDPRSKVQSMLEFLNCANEILLAKKLACVNDIIRPVVSTQQVARAFLKKIQDEDHVGVVTLEDILKA